MVFVTDMDIDEASYRQVVEDLQELYGKRIAPFHLPIRENGQFVGYVNVLQQRAKRWTDNGTVEKVEVPDYSKENLGICREALMEVVAETSEEFMDRYFNGEEFSEDEDPSGAPCQCSRRQHRSCTDGFESVSQRTVYTFS